VKYLLDTDHISFLQRRSGPEYAALAARLARHSPADFAFSIVSFHEQVVGAHSLITRSQTSVKVIRGYALLEQILMSFSAVSVLSFDSATEMVFTGLRSQRIRIATMDLRIAATPLARSAVLLTRNISDFSQVPNLITED
jgi:tRNA(fMet)-specific endonuclease VapC